RRLRAALAEAGREHGFVVHYPRPELCTDHGAMIAYAGACRAPSASAEPAPGLLARPRRSPRGPEPPATAAPQALGPPRAPRPRPELCTDDGAMIAYAGACRAPSASAEPAPGIIARPRWSLEELEPPETADPQALGPRRAARRAAREQ